MIRLIALSGSSLGDYRCGGLHGCKRNYHSFIHLRRLSGGTANDPKFLQRKSVSGSPRVWPFDLAWGTEFPDVDQQVLSCT